MREEISKFCAVLKKQEKKISFPKPSLYYRYRGYIQSSTPILSEKMSVFARFFNKMGRNPILMCDNSCYTSYKVRKTSVLRGEH